MWNLIHLFQWLFIERQSTQVSGYKDITYTQFFFYAIKLWKIKNTNLYTKLGIEVCVFYLSQFDSIEKKLSVGDILVTRNLGGLSFNKESLEKMNQISHAKNLPFICLPGYKNDDPSILSLSNAPVPVCQKMFSYYEAS